MFIQRRLPFITLVLMISFASVNAVLFTPALPQIKNYFSISTALVQQSITWFLVGYAIGQLFYGPIANRFGRKPALYIGILLQIMSSFVCVLAGNFHIYSLLVLGRFLLALGAGVGLKITFTLVSECYLQQEASQKLSYLMLAFAITPAIGVMISGYLLSYFAWVSVFYAGAVYGIILLLLATRLPETKSTLDLNALELKYLFTKYALQFKNLKIIAAGLLMGGSSCFVYIFASLAPLIAMNILHMKTNVYGLLNILPSLGLMLGSLISAQFTKTYGSKKIIQVGILITLFSSMLMLVTTLFNLSGLYILFLPMMLCYFGLSLLFANVSSLALNQVIDKANGSAVLNFVNIGTVTMAMLMIGCFKITPMMLPVIFISIASIMLLLSMINYDETT